MYYGGRVGMINLTEKIKKYSWRNPSVLIYYIMIFMLVFCLCWLQLKCRTNLEE